eukprot:CAMPEP_0175056112 /NCGR_PEP_ID=MMETSP0052_2-20121109/10478_1 /TAXON_ID=51329 ORGANISM="Polytomella parva, Strain SAG 63-3" /NCGR_SAMPLE_ID=MMETSP0052_2 /ASSEMBLY_ACC=CAM_ASM_000194 /LENGTH=479 /DNA_ID=CAMNT_0016321079 /DNA_START=108 /DNA_END=1547 /DNA_ORIENTATION=+
MYTNDTIGGLLNATFGNATEVIISAFALAKGGTSYLRVVQLSLLGSVTSNLLLVMGSAFIAGGIKQKVQTFSKEGINVNCSMLILAAAAVTLPSLLSETHSEGSGSKSELALSRFEAFVMMALYGGYLYFQLVTHKHLFDDDDDEVENNPRAATKSVSLGGMSESESETVKLLSKVRSDDKLLAASTSSTSSAPLPSMFPSHVAIPLPTVISIPSTSVSSSALPATANNPSIQLTSAAVSERHLLLTSSSSAAVGGDVSVVSAGGGANLLVGMEDVEAQRGEGGGVVMVVKDKIASVDESGSAKEEEEEKEEEKELSKTGCFVWLAIVAITIAWLSELITDAIKGASVSLGVPLPFITAILLPIVGNAAEHASAIVFAYRNRIEISLGVAVGSSTQVAVLILPLCVILAWCMGQPLDLNFNVFEAGVLVFSILLAVVVVQDGSANWIKGVLLVVAYIFTAAGFWCHLDPQLTSSVDGKE